jgi:hypothetical protein
MSSNNNDRIDTALTSTRSRRQALKLMGGGLVGGLAMATGITAATAHGHKDNKGRGKNSGEWDMDSYTFDGTGTVFAGEIDSFVGDKVTFTPRHFYKDGDTLMLTGDVSHPDGVGTFSAPVNLDNTWVAGTHTEMASVINGRASDVSLAQAGGSCDILNLEIAPIFLDLLGLQVELPNPLVLEIRAVSGAGNLLGNLLCAVAGLLDGNSPVGGLAGLLNNILRALGLA